MTTKLKDLRELVFEKQAGLCLWPSGRPHRAEELAHVEHRGMGGGPSRNRVDNLAALCVFHHDMLDVRRPLTYPALEALLAAAGCPVGARPVCAWSECDDPSVGQRALRVPHGRSFEPRSFCAGHAPLLTLETPIAGRRAGLRALMRELIRKRDKDTSR